MSALLDDLVEWLRIPSVSTGDPDRAALERAAQWVVDRVRAAGGDAEQVVIDGGNPLAVGELRAARRRRADRAGLRPLRRPGAGARPRPGTRRRSSPRSATGACTPAARRTTRATSCRCCTWPARWPARAPCRCTCACWSRARRSGRAEAVAEWVRATSAGPTWRSCSTAACPIPTPRRSPSGLRGMVDVDVTVRTARAQPALGPVRRHRAQRPARAARPAGARGPRRRRARARGAARRHRAGGGRRARVVACAGPRARTPSPRAAARPVAPAGGRGVLRAHRRGGVGGGQPDRRWRAAHDRARPRRTPR